MAVASPWSRELVSILVRNGIPVVVLDVNGSRQDPHWRHLTEKFLVDLRTTATKVHLIDLPDSHLFQMILGAREVRRIASETNARTILCLYGGMQAAIAWLSGISYTVYVVGSDILFSKGPKSIIQRLALRRARTVIANGEHLRDRTQAMLGDRPVSSLYLGIDVARFQPATDRLITASSRFICSRVFKAVYDNATIVRAFALLDHERQPATLDFLSVGPLLADVQALASDLLPTHRRDSVRFLGGVSDEYFLKALQSSSYYVSASHSDGTSASLLEAMACGLFPIVSDIPANREWISHGKNGLLFEAGNVEALRLCLQQVLDGLPWMTLAVSENQKKVAKLADTESNVHELIALLELKG